MHRLTPALVVDADPRGLEALAYGFQGEGWQPTLTPDYAGAPGAAAQSAPQLAVLVVRDPTGPALAALRALRESTAGPLLPVLVLGPENTRSEVRAMPGVDFLALPAFVRDVLTASKLLAAVHASSGTTGEEAALSGSLSEYGLFFLVRTMIGLGRSGILQVERANRRGEIRFSDGEVTGATVGTLQGTAALHQLLLWEEAALDLKLRSSVHRGSFNQRPEDLIEEAERFLRDFAHATKDLGPTSTVMVSDAETSAQAAPNLPTEVAPLLRLFDGQRTLGDVLEDSPFRVFDTLRVVTRLVDLGVLRNRDAPAPVKRPATIRILAENEPPAMVPFSPGQDVPTASVEKPARPAVAPRSGVPPKDQRTGPSNRRKLRRDRGTLEQRTLNRTPPLEPVPPTEATTPPLETVPPAAPVPASSPPAASGTLRASGTLGTRGELRSSAPREVPRTAAAPSVVVDMDPAPVAPQPATTSKPIQTVGGVMQARPSAKVPVPAPSPSSGSIELDPALMADMAAHEMASMPATPPPVLVAPPPAAAAPGAAAPPAAASPPAASAPPAAATPNGHAAPAPGAPEAEQDTRRNTGRRPSAEFNALERDFFAREADLYKQEHTESFDDLEHKQPPGRPGNRK